MEHFLNIFYRNVKENGNEPAISDENGSFTYSELYDYCCMTAANLKAHGVGRGNRVIVEIPRSKEFPACMVACWLIGAVAIPLSDDYPEERLAYIKKDSDYYLSIDEAFERDMDRSLRIEPVEPSFEDEGVVIYTSGSTGNPKGVIHDFYSMSATAERKFAVDEDESTERNNIIGFAAPFTFIAGIEQLLLTLSYGKHLVIAPDRIRRDPYQLAAFYNENHIESSFMSPRLVNFMVEHNTSLKTILVGSERITNLFFDNKPAIVNGYGSTETIGAVLAFPVDKKYENTPIGKPFNKEKAYVLDENGNEAEYGELCIAGHVAKGYLNRPKETQATFVKNPFRETDGFERMFRTGDLVRRLPDGNLVFMERKDWMIKINGQRVEPLEVESTIRRLPGIRSVAVKDYTAPNGVTYLSAYYVCDDSLTTEQIRKHCESNLTSYMVPTFYIRMEALPVNPNGKLDRIHLPAPDLSALKSDYEAPVNEAEEAICSIMEEVLKCGRIGRKDDFILLGGDSIKCIEVVDLMMNSSRFSGLERLKANAVLTPAMVLEYRTPQKIAEQLQTQERKIIAERDCVTECPLSESQRGVYMECISDPESTMYNIPFCCRLPRGTDLKKMAGAVRNAFSVHPAFETVICMRGYEPVMVRKKHDIRVGIENIDDLEEAKRAFVQPFDLENGPLYRAEVWHGQEDDYLAFDIHHVIFDGSSVPVLLGQIARAYGGEVLEEEQITMYDVALFEHEHEGEGLEESREFYEKLLGGAETDCLLLPDAPKDAPCTAGTLTIDAKLNPEQISRFAQQSGVTVNTVLMGAFAYVLARFGGAKESLFCTADNGRHDPRLRGTVGMFVRTLPVRVDFTEDTAVGDYLRSLQDTFFEELSHDNISFGELVQKYGIGNQITFIYQSELLSGAELSCGRLVPKEIERGSTQTDMDFMVTREEEHFTFLIHFRKNVYTEDLLRRFARIFENVVRGMVSSDTLGSVSLTDAEEEALLTSFAGVKVPYDAKKTVTDFFAESVKRYPEREAVVFEDKRLTYAQLDEITDRLAAELNRRGIGREQVVSVLIPRCEWMAIISLGVLKAGATYQPLDPSYPPERLSFMIKDAGAVLLIADSKLLSLVPEKECPVLLTEEICSLPDAGKLACAPEPEDLFLLLYTSGSTGTPKGCMIEHRNVAAYCGYICRDYGMTQEDHVLAYASYGFDANLMDMYPTWMSGATLYIASEEMRLDLPRLSEYIRENGITRAFMTTQVGRMFVMMDKNTGLKTLMMGGEKLVPFAPKPGCRYLNGYGPSECVCASSVYEITKYEDDLPIGKPVENLELYVLDEQGRRMPVGIPGELCVSGPQVSRGYLNRPEKTAEVFVPNPFGKEEPYLRMYRTGDIVRFLPDGNLQFIGRRDGQVKIRGFRVELTEVEEVIRRYSGIKDATVAAFEEPGGGKYIAAYVVSDETVDIEALHAFIRERKPPYMVPSVTMQLPAIPLNQNFKVNRKALPVPQRKTENIIPPETETQKLIFDLCAEVVGHTSFGIDTDLFDAGLTSIGTLKLNMMLADTFHTALRMDDLKRCGTVRALEKLLGGTRETSSYEMRSDYPITQTQQGIFVECSANPGSITYNIPLLMKLKGEVDGSRLTSAVKTAVNAHPYLKATLFADSTGAIRARRQDDAEPDVQYIVCDALPESRTLVQPFKMLDAPLYRAAVYSTPKGTYLFLDTHHILSDGTSEAILLDDISRAYAGESLGKESFTGFEVALDEEEARESERYQKAKEYYDSIFNGCENDTLPPVCPEDRAGGAASVTRVCSVPTDEVLNCCKSIKATPNAFMNAAFGFTLSRFSLLKDVVFTTIYNGRNDSRLGNAVSMLVKTLPVLVRTENDRPVSELIRETQNRLMDSMSNDIFSFAEISAAYGIRADIMLIYQGDNFSFDTLCGVPAETIQVLPPVAKAQIAVTVNIVNGRFELSADYRRDLYCEAFVKSLLDSFNQVIDAFTKVTGLKEISMLSPSAEKQIDKMNDTALAFDNIPVPRIFEKHVSAQPDCLAVVDRNRRMTYAELDRAANRAAHALIECGIGKDTVVCILMDRTIDISLCELAILKAGGAFLGVLPSYPDDRIDFCLRDSGSPLVITTPEVMAEHPDLFGNDKPYRPVTVSRLLDNTDETVPDVEIPMDSLAYCIYTSGSTGKPKGVMLEHHNLVCSARQGNSEYSRFIGDRRRQTVLALSSISFDVSVFDNLVCLMNGMTVVMASDEEIHNPGMLASLMLDNGVEAFVCTPSFITNYIAIPEFQTALRQIKCVVVGAEAFPPALFTRFREISPDASIINGYGPSECTITCSAKEIQSPENITIGGPDPNCALYVLDAWGNILPPYACGELIICGETVGRGYINLPERNSASFFTLKGLRAYHSGDTVRMNKDGEMEFFGRMDNQVKLRGFRIELDEIEKAICSYPGIKQSKVIVRNNGSEDYLAGYFTAETQVEISALTQHLRSSLTYYMVPDVMAQLDAMPLTPNGKIDKKALPEIRKEHKKTGRRTAKKSLEQELCDIFKSVLGLDEYYADDNFFEMGGTSLSASKVIMQLMAKEIKVEYQNIFDYPTPEELAEFVQSQRAEKSKEDADEKDNDSSGIAALLENNTLAHAAEVYREPLGDVLLTGAVGFLGVHVLHELMERKEGRILCLVRKRGTQSAEKRLKTMLVYYFSNPFDDEFTDRIKVLDADITDENLSEVLKNEHFDTLINCAACVKHYAADDVIEHINVHGVENLIRCAKEKGARMIQVSTTSVPGVHTDDTYRRGVKMHENELFVVDDMSNKYVISKYHAELKMLEGIRSGLRGKIIRVGNLMGRHSDGEFQINFNTNAFMKALRGFATLGKCPISHATDPMSFSPVDLTAKVIVLLAGTNDCFTAFHADNRFRFDEMQLIEAANECGITVKPVPDEEYYTDYYRALGNEKLNERMTGLVTNDRPDLHSVETDNLFTANILYRLGFSWPFVDKIYLRKALQSLISLDYFSFDNQN